MAAQAHAIGSLRRPFQKADDLGDVAPARYVKAAIPVTILAFHSLLFMESVLEILGDIPVASRAGLGAE
jgi:hypothetical protein